MEQEAKDQAIQALLDKAASAADSGDAMRFSQAALNAANAVGTLKRLEFDLRTAR